MRRTIIIIGLFVLLYASKADAGEYYFYYDECSYGGQGAYLERGQTLNLNSNFYYFNNRIMASITAPEDGYYVFITYQMFMKTSWLDTVFHDICRTHEMYDVFTQPYFTMGNYEFIRQGSGTFIDDYIFFPDDPDRTLTEFQVEWYAFIKPWQKTPSF